MAIYLLLSGLGAWFAAFTLAREGYQLALSGTKPSCDINPFLTPPINSLGLPAMSP